jgi:hypothetical protein
MSAATTQESNSSAVPAPALRTQDNTSANQGDSVAKRGKLKRVQVHVDPVPQTETVPARPVAAAPSSGAIGTAVTIPTTPKELAAAALRLCEEGADSTHALSLLDHSLSILRRQTEQGLTASVDLDEKRTWSEWAVDATVLALDANRVEDAVRYAELGLFWAETPLTLQNAAWAAVKHAMKSGDPGQLQAALERGRCWFLDAQRLPLSGNALRSLIVRRSAALHMMEGNPEEAISVLMGNSSDGESRTNSAEGSPLEPVDLLSVSLLALVWGAAGYTGKALSLASATRQTIGDSLRQTTSVEGRIGPLLLSITQVAITLDSIHHGDSIVECLLQGQPFQPATTEAETMTSRLQLHRELAFLVNQLNASVGNNRGDNRSNPVETPPSVTASSPGFLLGAASGTQKLVCLIGRLYALLARLMISAVLRSAIDASTFSFVSNALNNFVSLYPHILSEEVMSELFSLTLLNQALLALYPDTSLGQTAPLENRVSTARSRAAVAVSVAPSNPDAHLVLGLAHLIGGTSAAPGTASLDRQLSQPELQLALCHLSTAVQYNPTSSTAVRSLIIAKERLGDTQGALELAFTAAEVELSHRYAIPPERLIPFL